MAVESIDTLVCDGCKICVTICPLDVLRFDEKLGKPFVAYGDDCMSCLMCEHFCPTEAIRVIPKQLRPIPLPY